MNQFSIRHSEIRSQLLIRLFLAFLFIGPQATRTQRIFPSVFTSLRLWFPLAKCCQFDFLALSQSNEFSCFVDYFSCDVFFYGCAAFPFHRFGSIVLHTFCLNVVSSTNRIEAATSRANEKRSLRVSASVRVRIRFTVRRLGGVRSFLYRVCALNRSQRRWRQLKYSLI